MKFAAILAAASVLIAPALMAKTNNEQPLKTTTYELAQIRGTAYKPVTIAVKKITNNAGSIWWWRPSLSKKLSDMLANELKSTGHFTLVERQSINQVLDEQELSDLGITRQSTAPKRE